MPTTVPSTTRKPECSCDETVPLGVADGTIPDDMMTASSTLISIKGRRYTGPSQARLNNRPSKKGKGAWVPKDMESYLRIDFNRMQTLKGIRTQGSPDGTKYVTRFFLFYTTDGKKWQPAFGVRYILIIHILSIAIK